MHCQTYCIGLCILFITKVLTLLEYSTISSLPNRMYIEHENNYVKLMEPAEFHQGNNILRLLQVWATA